MKYLLLVHADGSMKWLGVAAYVKVTGTHD
jgi:hypothetical protein